MGIGLIDGDDLQYISAPKVQTVLVTLAAMVDKPVSVGRLALEIWNESPPRLQNAGMHVYVSQLRKAIRSIGSVPDPIVTTSNGYALQGAQLKIDLVDFKSRLKNARALEREGNYQDAIPVLYHLLEMSEELQRPAHFNGPILHGLYTWIAESRHGCKASLIRSLTAVGEHRAVIAHLPNFIREHPLHEPFYGQLMLAYYRVGRRADALRTFRILQHRLRDELGLDPCTKLQELYRSILLSDSSLLSA
ncbi:hypothetical protein B8W66_11145 [Mycobacterium decipiens]|uniref:Bacterial transcriptional activator domain-containing protein n=1 Tax=Mycobacterium decipiens TaxID=1430326 RepID=A0A1X2LVE1_9MYCO|nr:hypothetical protein B8W66_11145 [Mycobacterium decipiens]